MLIAYLLGLALYYYIIMIILYYCRIDERKKYALVAELRSTPQFTRLTKNMMKTRVKYLHFTVKNHTIILYYYSMFYPHDGGMFTFWSRSPEARNGTSVPSTPRPPILSSIPSSTKHWKINVFRHFNIVKNHQKYLQNTSQHL